MELFDNLAPLGRSWVQFWRPLGFEGIPKSIIFEYFQHKFLKTGVQEGVLNKYDFGMDFFFAQEMYRVCRGTRRWSTTLCLS